MDHTTHTSDIPPAVTPPPISFMALIVTQDIYKDNEILIFKGADFSGNPFRPNNEPNSTRYKTYQCNSVLKNCSIRPYIHPVPVDLIVHNGGHMGQRYDR